MNSRISLYVVGQATSLLIMISFILCIGFDIIFPQYAMYPAWYKLFPGFEWISWKSFLIGVVEAYAYGWYITLVWVPLFNFFSSRQPNTGQQ